MDWRPIASVGLGSALGGIARYLVAVSTTKWDYPVGTLAVNVVGCFAIGVLLFGGLSGQWLTHPLRLLLVVGVLGGFTTMSAFGAEAVELVAEGAAWKAVGYAALTFLACLASAWVGRAAGLALWPHG